MTTLAELNSTLERVENNTGTTARTLDRFISFMEMKRGDDLEDRRERKAEKSSKAVSVGTSSSTKSDSGFFKNLQARDLLTPGVLAASFAPKLAKGIITRGLPAALATAFADDIGNWVNSQTGSAELGSAAERATLGGTFGLLLGKKFVLIGAAVGALATEENKAAATELGQALINKAGDAKTAIQEWANSENAEKIAEKFGGIGQSIREYATNLPTAGKILTGLQTKVGEGITGLTGFINGGFDDETFQNNWVEAAGTLATFAFFLGPGKFIRMIKFLAGFKKLAAGAALYGAYKLFTGEMTDDDLTTDEIVGAAGMTAALGYGGVKATQALRGRRNGGTPPPKAPSSNILGKINGKDVVRSSAGNLAYAGADGKATTNLLSKADAEKFAGKGNWWNKFPKLKALRMIPGAGLLFAAMDSVNAGSIMLDESTSDKQKADAIGSLVGGVLGGIGFAQLGAVLGTAAGTMGFPGLGSLIGGFGGTAAMGTIGYFAGDWLGSKIMNYLMDTSNAQASSNSAVITPEMSKLFSGAGTSAYTAQNSISRPNVTSGVAEGTYTMTAQQQAMAYRSASGNNVGQIGDNTTNNVSNSQPIMLNSGVVFDPNDMVLQ